MNDSDRILTRRQLAKELQISERKVAEMERKGMPVIKMGRKTRRYNLDRVLQWLADINDLAKETN